MNRYSLTCLSDSSLLRDLKALVLQDRATTALLIAHLGEVDARRLYAGAGYPSMFEYCVKELHFSEDTTFKRIRVARAARDHPSIYHMLADGRLHLTAVVFLAPHLAAENADDLLAAATHKSKTEIERLLAERFPQPDLPAFVAPVAMPLSPSGLVPEPLSQEAPPAVDAVPTDLVPSPVTVTSRVAPLAPQRYAIQCTVGQCTYEKLEYARALLGHAVPSGNLDQVLDRALDALIQQLERRKFAKTDRPRPCRPSDNARQIPADVKRAVWQRDGGQCTFVSASGHRCESRTRLEFDHVEPVARGGYATVRGLRLRCRAHNQFTAQRAFGRDFMSAKRASV